jgi:hypothetical protein
MRRFWWEMWRGGSLRDRTIAIERGQMAIVGRVASGEPNCEYQELPGLERILSIRSFFRTGKSAVAYQGHVCGNDQASRHQVPISRITGQLPRAITTLGRLRLGMLAGRSPEDVPITQDNLQLSDGRTMRRNRSPLPILSNESVGENYRVGKRLPVEVSHLRGTPGDDRRITVIVHLHA